MKNDLQKTEQRTKQYWFIDGLAEIGFGLICLLLGIYFFANAILPGEGPLVALLEGSLALIMIAGALLANRLVSNFKAHITYPRTGYVSYRRTRQVPRWVAGLIAGLIAVLITVLIASYPGSEVLMPAITGGFVSAVWLYIATKIGLWRLYAQSAASLFLGGGISLAGIGNTPGLALFYSLFAALMFLSGGLTLVNYLKQHPSAE